MLAGNFNPLKFIKMYIEESKYFMKCRDCGHMVDYRDFHQVFKHEHIEILQYTETVTKRVVKSEIRLKVKRA